MNPGNPSVGKTSKGGPLLSLLNSNKITVISGILQQHKYSYSTLGCVLGAVRPSNTPTCSAEIPSAVAAPFLSCMPLLVRPSGLMYSPENSATKLLCCTALYGLL